MAHGLGLGPIQFPPSYRPYTPPERRRRGAAPHARPAGPLQLKPSTVPAGAAAGQAGRGPATPGGGAPDPALTILPDDIAPVQVAFLLRTDRQRMGSSFAASAASHVVAVGLVALLLSLAPERIYEVVDINRYEGIIWLPAENMDAMIAGPDRRTVAGRIEHALLLFLYNTGARASEAAGLQVEDLHLPERTGENARATIHGKGEKIRITPIWTSTAKALAALSGDRPPGCGSVFWSRHRKPYTRHGIIELVERAAARVPELEGRRITPHSLRHTCACHLLRSGVDINTIRAWLGHVSLATTNIYAEIDLKAKEEAMKSTCPGDAGDEPRWKTKGGLLEQLKTI